MTSSPATVSYAYHPLWNVIEDGGAYEPFPWQVQHVHSKVDAGYRFITLACGRRSGKTTAMKAEVVRAALRPKENGHAPIIYIAGPNHELASRIFDPVWDLFVPDKRGEYLPPLFDLYLSHDKTSGVINLKNGTKIARKTGDDPKSMQGERVTAAFVEEAQDMNEDAWKMLIPALIDSNGVLFTIGVPWGRNRFRTLFKLGKNPDEEGYYSASVTTLANPNITQRMLDDMMATMTEIEIRAHIYAEWVDEYGAVFRRPEDLFDWEDDREPVGPYVMGVDVGKLHDFTVMYVIDIPTMKVVARDRFNKFDYPAQADILAQHYYTWLPRFISLDATGVGEAMQDLLRERGCAISPFKFTVETKQSMVGTLIKAAETKLLKCMKDDNTLRTELELFEGKLVASPGGTRVAYEAADGAHDDCVMALGLACRAAYIFHNVMSGTTPSRGRYVDMNRKRKRDLTDRTFLI